IRGKVSACRTELIYVAAVNSSEVLRCKSDFYIDRFVFYEFVRYPLRCAGERSRSTAQQTDCGTPGCQGRHPFFDRLALWQGLPGPCALQPNCRALYYISGPNDPFNRTVWNDS